MKGDSRWVTALHYAFQDEEYLVRMPRKLEGRGGGGGEYGQEIVQKKKRTEFYWNITQ